MACTKHLVKCLQCKKSVAFSQLIEHLSEDCSSLRGGIRKSKMGIVFNMRIFFLLQHLICCLMKLAERLLFIFTHFVYKDIYHFFSKSTAHLRNHYSSMLTYIWSMIIMMAMCPQHFQLVPDIHCPWFQYTFLSSMPKI